jgi:septum site-determining protein MinC
MATPAVEFKGTSFTLSVIHLINNDMGDLAQSLSDKVAQAPAFFKSAPVVVNIDRVELDIDYNLLRETVEATGLLMVGVTGHNAPKQREKIQAAQLAVMSAGRAVMEPDSSNTVSSTPSPQLAQNPPKIVRSQIRSGQQIYAKDTDLVIIGSVSNGAEVIADGNIHIYGTLRGRAIAGASGQVGCGIFCQNLQAELVSIAGHYQLSDSLQDEWQRACSIELQEQHLKFVPLN